MKSVLFVPCVKQSQVATQNPHPARPTRSRDYAAMYNDQRRGVCPFLKRHVGRTGTVYQSATAEASPQLLSATGAAGSAESQPPVAVPEVVAPESPQPPSSEVSARGCGQRLGPWLYGLSRCTRVLTIGELTRTPCSCSIDDGTSL